MRRGNRIGFVSKNGPIKPGMSTCRRGAPASIMDIVSLHADGKEMDEADWTQGHLRAIGFVLAGDAIEEKDTRGNQLLMIHFWCSRMRIMNRSSFCYPHLNHPPLGGSRRCGGAREAGPGSDCDF